MTTNHQFPVPSHFRRHFYCFELRQHATSRLLSYLDSRATSERTPRGDGGDLAYDDDDAREARGRRRAEQDGGTDDDEYYFGPV